MKNDAVTEKLVERFQEWDARIDRLHLIWITWALALDVNLQVEFYAIVSDVRQQMQREMRKLEPVLDEDTPPVCSASCGRPYAAEDNWQSTLCGACLRAKQP